MTGCASLKQPYDLTICHTSLYTHRRSEIGRRVYETAVCHSYRNLGAGLLQRNPSNPAHRDSRSHGQFARDNSRGGPSFRLEDRDVLYRIHRDALDQVFADFASPPIKATELSSICRLLGESGWDVIELYVHPSVNPRLQLVAGSLDGGLREVNRIFREEKPDTWPGYSLADFCEDFQRAG